MSDAARQPVGPYLGDGLARLLQAGYAGRSKRSEPIKSDELGRHQARLAFRFGVRRAPRSSRGVTWATR